MKEHDDTPKPETPVQRAIREANEQEAAKLDEAREIERRETVAQARPPEPETKTVTLVLQLTYNAHGSLEQIRGVCQGRAVFSMGGHPSLPVPDVGEAARETLRRGALGALLGA